jgi:hypothetical protein
LASPYDGKCAELAWAKPQECLWEAPDNMMTMWPLRALYSKAMANTKVEMDGLRQFFQGTLRIPNISYTHIIEELKAISKEETVSLDTVRNLYQLLQEEHRADPIISESLR